MEIHYPEPPPSNKTEGTGPMTLIGNAIVTLMFCAGVACLLLVMTAMVFVSYWLAREAWGLL